MSVANNITFATANTSLTEKEQTYKISSCVFALSACNKGLGLAYIVFVQTNAMLALL